MLPLDRLADLVLGRARVLAQQRGRAHQHPRRAVAALERVVVAERLLQRASARRRRRGPRPSRSTRRRPGLRAACSSSRACRRRSPMQAPQLPVSQPMWRAGEVEVVANEVDRAACAPRPRARRSSPLTVTVIACEDDTAAACSDIRAQCRVYARLVCQTRQRFGRLRLGRREPLCPAPDPTESLGLGPSPHARLIHIVTSSPCPQPAARLARSEHLGRSAAGI